jgi:phosphoribosylglycinamide formyltransferase 1
LLNIAVLVSGGGTNLQALIDAEKRGEIENGKITLVVASRSDAYALERAKNNDIKTEVLLRKGFESTDAYSDALLEILENNNIDLVVLAGFMTIISSKVPKVYKNKIINIHPALIPSFCGKGFYGLHVHEAALERGVKLSGATVHFVNEVCDGGPIIIQKAVEVMDDDTPETLQKRIMVEAEWKILPKAVSLFCQGKLSVEGNRVIVSK